MNMDPKVLETIIQMARQSDLVQIVTPPREPGHVYWMRGNDGQLSRHEAEPAPRRHEAHELDTVARFAVDFSAIDGGDVEVWYSRSGVVCYLDADTRRDQVIMPLRPSEEMKALVETSNRMHAHKEFLRLLRTRLGRAAPMDLVNALKHVRFQTTAAGEAQAVRGKASVGKTLESQLEGLAPIPDEVTIYVRCFLSSGDLYPVRCSVEVDEQEVKFGLFPLPGEVEGAWVQAEGDLGRAVRRLLQEVRGEQDGYDEPVGVFYGVP